MYVSSNIPIGRRTIVKLGGFAEWVDEEYMRFEGFLWDCTTNFNELSGFTRGALSIPRILRSNYGRGNEGGAQYPTGTIIMLELINFSTVFDPPFN